MHLRWQDRRVNETGIIAYDLAAAYFCEGCGRLKTDRMLLRVPSGCATCDEVITRHRCTGRPPIESLAAGASWECPGCGSVWTADPAACTACGTPGMERNWSVVMGDRMDTAPRHEPYVPVAMRNILPRRPELPRGVFREPVRPAGDCYTLPGGGIVHLKPGCRC